MSFEIVQPDYNDDYNYPPLSRKDLMYLDSIRPRDFPVKKLNQINSNRDWSTNLYNLDIEKSVPYRSNIYTNKVDFINKIDDIEEAQPKKEKILNKPNFILNVRDIENAYPKKENPISQRHVNPLNPVYKLPSFQVPTPEPPPKFIRDQMDISDIAKAKPNKLFPMKMRPPKTYDEIEGNHPKKPYERRNFYDSFRYDDVTKKKRKFRNTNPLDPDYGKNYGGYIEGSKPFLPFYNYNINIRNSLFNKDIEGSSPGTTNNYSNYRYENKERFETKDILGASADTKRYGISTKRCTNPLLPNYNYIGNSENLDCFGTIVNDRYINNIDKNKYLTRTISNPNLDRHNNIENFNSNFINNDIKYNNKININRSIEFYNNQDFHNIIKNDRNTRKMYKSQSYSQLKKNLPTIILNNDNNNNQPIDINYKLSEFNNKPNFNPELYKKPIPNYESKHDSTLVLTRPNKENRLDVKMQKFNKLSNLNDFNYNIKNVNDFNRNIKNNLNMKNDFQTDINKNELDTIYQKYSINEGNDTFEERFDNIINRKRFQDVF